MANRAELDGPVSDPFMGWAGEGVVMVFRDMASAREWLDLPPEEE